MRFEDYFHSPKEAVMRTYYGKQVLPLILPRLPNFEGDPIRKWAPDINRAVLSWLDQDKPFFVFLNYFDVHDPYVPPRLTAVSSPNKRSLEGSSGVISLPRP
jgi:hypothetical protein